MCGFAGSACLKGMNHVVVTVSLHPKHLDLLKEYLKDGYERGRSGFIRYCIGYFFEKAAMEDKAVYLKIVDEIRHDEMMKELLAKESMYNHAYRAIRRSGMFIDQVKGTVARDYPKGVLEDERRALGWILKQREDLAKALGKHVLEEVDDAPKV